MISSIALGNVVADALGEGRPRVQLQLKRIRAADHISFKGYGRGAAAMGSLDAARLMIAVAGALFATDALEALLRFKDLPGTSPKGNGRVLEGFLKERIDAVRSGQDASFFGSAMARPFNPAGEAALKLIWTGPPGKNGPSAAVVRWFRNDGKSDAATFSNVASSRPILDEGRFAAATGGGELVRSATVPTRALHTIAAAL
ncbi:MULTISPECIES: hypothetical protein [Bradyrhizobium]|uniref:Uncharacterized protein n=1 Tax=Bradyrhizobium barranii subsp. barranii TaxID=2823807 RepID=A0A7Z0Q913_9BRAD|nr:MULTISPECIES: hypothetical protein [Bradyrhizobium]MBR0999307.1 hypothetical protein [Bradyrhizobium liaoningense]MCP1747050.1 hypothetical protein [Bradyrhizobium japonicum]MCP1865692.1 hypothetical protein [Bradyrhizobium japonicum]MCP1895537.1 hypothetical protein [Bradyrhizobium japonicum]MCW2328920.1 hypothetical protein [Bradyrhizobium japonicum]